MNKEKVILIILSLILSLRIFSQSTEIVYLSGEDAANTVNWDFFCTGGKNSGEWTKIPVPSNWELQGFGTYNYGHDWGNKEIKLGKEHGLYKHEFEVPDSWKGKTINIVFDGAMTDTKVEINGKSAGEMHQGGFYRFKYNISKLLKYGEANSVEVDVAKHSANESINRAERQADFWIFGGIYRPVFLEVLPETHMSGVAINPKADGSFKVLMNWTEHSVPLKTSDFVWAKGDAWAAQVTERNGKFYWYVTVEHVTISGKSIGVAVSDSPTRPFKDAIGKALIANDMTTGHTDITWDDIDPTVFTDDDGQAYLYWGNTVCYWTKLKENMVEIDGEIHTVNLPNFTEAPWIHKHNDWYYLSYAYQFPEKTAYAMSKSITGPWEYKGILNGLSGNYNTNHQSIMYYQI